LTFIEFKCEILSSLEWIALMQINHCRDFQCAFDATFYKWRSRYGGIEISDARKLKALEDENRR